ncbi:hypothetical protein CBR_g35025 [Chara braunii]|uniref:Uncharacterized protein n=1 Tax=Chara braunii TaxID=69332 RepID=A0A388LK28_CHABU|nr:hypothetical protein CBR_g35025 [Chara braunii]|eukprot:GBG82659.1 hypothetical protein CBR_g35025 [Chara braunii]
MVVLWRLVGAAERPATSWSCHALRQAEFHGALMSWGEGVEYCAGGQSKAWYLMAASGGGSSLQQECGAGDGAMRDATISILSSIQSPRLRGSSVRQDPHRIWEGGLIVGQRADGGGSGGGSGGGAGMKPPSMLGRSSSSLIRSQTVTVGICGLAAAGPVTPAYGGGSPSVSAQGSSTQSARDRRLLEAASLSSFMPLVLVAVCIFIWFVMRAGDQPTWKDLLNPSEASAGQSWLEFAILLACFFAAVLACRMAVPYLRVLMLRVSSGSSFTRTIVMTPKGLHLLPVVLRRNGSGGGGAGGAEEAGKLSLCKADYGSIPHSSSSGSGSDSGGVATTLSSTPRSIRATASGVHTYTNGDRYEGEFYQGKCSGCGVYYFAMSGRYEGEWVDGKYDGNGVETWSRGSRYRGQYRQGLRDGYGVYRFYTGDVYAGEWSKGQSHGIGMQTCADGSRYIGEFQWGAKHGYGKYIFRNGDTYAGEYFCDKMHGYGCYHFSNGHRYEGAWHEGRKQGLGLYTFRNGETRAGNWHLGALETRSTQSAPPNSPTAVNHSRVLHAVQEARRAAAKAEALPTNQDRVSKAVAAANRAALAARVAAVKAAAQRARIGGLM